MPLKKSASPEAFKSNLKAEMKAGKPQKQALAIAYATKRKAAHKYQGGMMGGNDEPCPDCYASDMGVCSYHSENMSDKPGSVDQSMETYAEGGAVDAERPLHTKPVQDETGIEELHPEEDASPMEMVDYGESSEMASDMERDAPQRNENISLAQAVMKDRKRMHGGQPEDEGDVSTRRMEAKAPNNVQSKDAMYARGGEVSIPTQEEEDEDELTKPQTHDAIHMSKGGMAYESNYGDEQTAPAGNLHGTIDPPTDEYETKDSDEMDAPEQDGRYQRGLNLEPVHDMTDDEHDISTASLAQSVLRDRRKARRRK